MAIKATDKDRIASLEAFIKLVTGQRDDYHKRVKSLEAELAKLRALIRSENMPELFDVNDDATTELAIEVAELKAELARHKWHRIDPDDPGTWPPEENEMVLIFTNEGYPIVGWLENGVIESDNMLYGWTPTHYHRIVGPEDGE